MQEALDWANLVIKDVYGPKLKGLYPISFILPDQTGVTKFTSKDDAFNLNKAQSGTVKKEVYPPSDTEQRALFRGIIGFSVVKQAFEQKNKALLVYLVTSIIIDGIRQLSYEIGDISNREIVLERPAIPDQYLMTSENYAGYELRLCVLN